MMKESSIVNSILKYLNSVPYCRARKIHGSGWSKGWPDILCVKHGIAFFFEVKRPGAKATLLQEKELEKWSYAGAQTKVVYSVEDVKGIMEREFPNHELW